MSPDNPLGRSQITRARPDLPEGEKSWLLFLGRKMGCHKVQGAQARVILGDAERQVAEKFGEAAKTYANNPTAFHLRAMELALRSANACWYKNAPGTRTQ
jgi:hypothetical protein